MGRALFRSGLLPPDREGGFGALEPILDLCQEACRIDTFPASHGAFPDFEDAPPAFKQLRSVSLVPRAVRIDFAPPELHTRRRQAKEMTVVPVPETPVYEYRCRITAQHEIGTTRKILHM